MKRKAEQARILVVVNSSVDAKHLLKNENVLWPMKQNTDCWFIPFPLTRQFSLQIFQTGLCISMPAIVHPRKFCIQFPSRSSVKIQRKSRKRKWEWVKCHGRYERKSKQTEYLRKQIAKYLIPFECLFSNQVPHGLWSASCITVLRMRTNVRWCS